MTTETTVTVGRARAGTRRPHPALPFPPGPARLGRVWRRLRRHRRGLSVALLAVASGLAVDAVAADPPPSVPVVVAAADLPAGRPLVRADLATAHLPPGAVPDGAVTEPEAIGLALAGPVRRGEPLTDARFVGPSQLTAAPPGTVAVPVPVDEPSTLELLRAGDAVRLIAGSTTADPLAGSTLDAEVLVERAVVLRTPPPTTDGLLGGAGSPGGRGVLLLAMSTSEAISVADSSGRRHLSVAVLP